MSGGDITSFFAAQSLNADGDVAMIAADELEGLVETAHLLRSPKNAERFLTALARARSTLRGSIDEGIVRYYQAILSRRLSWLSLLFDL